MSKELKNGQVTVFDLNNKITIIGLKCQTDFLARSELFGNKAYEICRYIHNENWGIVATILKEMHKESKEIIELSDYHTVKLNPEKFATQYYVHHDNMKIGITTLKFKEWSKEIEQLAKNIAMHVVAFDPIYIREDEINWDEVDLTFTEDQMKGKPEKVIEMMKIGKKKKYMKEHLLLEQPFIKDLKISVQDAINKVDSSIELIDAYGIFV